jgi:gliding motility-associated-like protein
MKKLFFVTQLLFSILSVFGQHNNQTWYFKDGYGIKFKNNSSSIVQHPDKKITHSVQAYDKNTGDLLFYTNGFYVWDKNDNYMVNGEGIIKFNLTNYAQKTYIIPYPDSDTKYYIFYKYHGILYYATVDMSRNSGLGEVIEKEKKFLNLIGFSNWGTHTNAIIQHSYNNSLWFVTYREHSQKFYVYNISEKGIDTTPVISGPIGLVPTSGVYFTTSHDGKKIVMLYGLHSTAIDATGATMVFDFDKTCGTVSNPIRLGRAHPHWHYSSVCFSPDNKKIYAHFRDVLSGNSPRKDIIVQYYGSDFSSFDTVIIFKEKVFGSLELGRDNKIYVGTTEGIDIIASPNNTAKLCNYQQNFYQLPNTALHPIRFSIYYRDKAVPGPSPDNPGLNIEVKGVCVGDSTYFSIAGDLQPDSIFWHFGDTLNPDSTSKLFSPAHLYTSKGKYHTKVVWYKCKVLVEQLVTVEIYNFDSLFSTTDTSFCHNDSVLLTSDIQNVSYIWNTGETTPVITVKNPGNYWLEVSSGNCKAKDSIKVTEHPPILINLGDDFTICEHDTDDLVKLDAGKGYSKYKWTPTQDTTQWIIVKQAGDYYVVVEDYRGCKGDDGSKVLRLCSFDFHLPNAFTPNNDGLNDVFKPTTSDIYKLNFEIYNTWGESVFKTNNPQQGWNGTYKGKPCPEGVYLYKISFNGFSNKQLKTYNFKGNVSLLR